MSSTVDDTSSLNPKLLRDLENRLGVGALIEWLEVEAEQLSLLGASEIDWSIAFTPKLLKERGIASVSAGEIGSDAMILSGASDGYRIIFRTGLPDGPPYYPRRFAIAHEIAHTYWFAGGGSCDPLSPLQSRTGRDTTIEALCNRFAACLLLPTKRVSRALDLLTRGRTKECSPLDLIPVLSREFRIAERAVARRVILRLDNADVEAIVCLRNAHANGPLFRKERWLSSWCAFPDQISERGIRKNAYAPLSKTRVIPPEMVPRPPLGEVRRIPIDQRWRDGIIVTDGKAARQRFSERVPSGQQLADVCRLTVNVGRKTEERIYIGLLSRDTT